jgi:adenosylcobinamide-phosphate guanylyltransferase
MKITAIVMAGGKGTRMVRPEEKPLLQIKGKPVVLHVLEALRNAKNINQIIVAISDYTSRTEELLRDLRFDVLKTPGKEYVSDLAFAVKTLRLQTVLVIAADMPFITGEILDRIVEHYAVCGKPAMTVVVPLETKQKLGMSEKYAFQFKGKPFVPSGINMIDGSRIDDGELEQEILVVDEPEVAININTIEELRLAQERCSIKST